MSTQVDIFLKRLRTAGRLTERQQSAWVDALVALAQVAEAGLSPSDLVEVIAAMRLAINGTRAVLDEIEARLGKVEAAQKGEIQ